MDELLRTNPKEFQKISQRIITAVNPEREQMSDARQIHTKIKQHIDITKDRRPETFALHRGPELLVKEAEKGKKWAQVCLGWIKPWQKVIEVKVPRHVVRWMIRGYREKIFEHELAIARARIKLRELGVKIGLHHNKRIREIEERLLGFRKKQEKYWWKR